MKTLLVCVAILALFITSACAVLDGPAGSLVVDAATRQAVFRYIDAGETEADKSTRARSVVETVRRVDEYLEGSPVTTTSGILAVVNASVQWDKLTPPDRFLVQDMLSLVELNLASKQREGLLDPGALVAVRRLLNTAVSAAALL